MSTTETIPKNAYVFNTEQDGRSMFSDGDNASDDKRPVKLTALCGKLVKHWWWGSVIFDLAGFEPSGDQLTIDFNHNPDEELGYLDHFETGKELVCTGYLLPFGNDTAAKIIHRAKRGRKYQCSVTVDEYLRTETLEQEGMTAEVNGTTVKVNATTGPITIFRKYSVMGVAICSYATDKGTKTQIFNQGARDVRQEASLTHAPNPSPLDSVSERNQNMTDTPKEPALPVVDGREMFKTFCTLYGTERAAEYFAAGLDESQAKEKYFEDVKADLKKFSDESDKKDEKIAELEDKIAELEKDDENKDEKDCKDNKDHAAKEADYAAKITALETELVQVRTAAAKFGGEQTPVAGNQQQAVEPKTFMPFTPEQQAYAAQVKQDMVHSVQKQSAK